MAHVLLTFLVRWRRAVRRLHPGGVLGVTNMVRVGHLGGRDACMRPIWST